MYDPITIETGKDRLYEAAVCKVKGTGGASLKTFQTRLLQNWRSMRFQYAIPMHACKPRCQGSHSVARHHLGASQRHYPSYFLSPFMMIVANQLYHPCEYKTIGEKCEERIIHTELNVHQSNLKIDFLLLSRTFLPVGVAYKTTDNHSFSWYSAFSGQSFQFLLKYQARNDDGMEYCSRF